MNNGVLVEVSRGKRQGCLAVITGSRDVRAETPKYGGNGVSMDRHGSRRGRAGGWAGDGIRLRRAGAEFPASLTVDRQPITLISGHPSWEAVLSGPMRSYPVREVRCSPLWGLTWGVAGRKNFGDGGTFGLGIPSYSIRSYRSRESPAKPVIRPFRRAARRYCVSVRGRRCFVALAGGTSELCSISGDAPMCGSTPRSGLRPPPVELRGGGARWMS